MTTRQRSITIGLVAGVVLAAAVLVGLLALRDSGDDGVVSLGPDEIPTAEAVAGRQVPGDAFEYFDGTTGSFADFEGRPLVVNFFAEWCAPCVKELPDFEAVHQAVGDQVAFLGLNTNDIAARGKALAERAGVTFTLASDPRGDFLASMGGIRMPATVFVAPDGTILETKLGGLDQEALTAKLREHFPEVTG